MTEKTPLKKKSADAKRRRFSLLNQLSCERAVEIHNEGYNYAILAAFLSSGAPRWFGYDTTVVVEETTSRN